MKKAILLICSLMVLTAAWGQEKDILDKIKPREHSFTRQGNEAFSEGRYAESETYYMKALDKNGDYFKAAFNLGDAMYRQERYANAAQQFERASAMATTKDEKGKAFYNLGNARMADKQYDKAIEAYRRSLINDPTNADARYNMLYAMKMLPKQQKQDKQDDKKDPPPEPTEWAKKRKKEAENMMLNQQYEQALKHMETGLEIDSTVAAFGSFMQRLQQVNAIDKSGKPD
jgi:tetratricopeptide (TPR) repeat protein